MNALHVLGLAVAFGALALVYAAVRVWVTDRWKTG